MNKDNNTILSLFSTNKDTYLSSLSVYSSRRLFCHKERENKYLKTRNSLSSQFNSHASVGNLKDFDNFYVKTQIFGIN